MPKLYLHMGFHKTASTSFQATCHVNKKKLESMGLIYPLFKCLGVPEQQEIRNHSIPLFSLLTSDPSKYHINIRWNVKDVKSVNNGYRNQLSQLLNVNDGRDIILSGEGISVLKYHELSQLFSLLSKSNYEVVPLVLIRSPYSFHCSAAQQRARQGNYVDFTKFQSQIEKIQVINSLFKDTVKYIPMSIACQHESGPVGYMLEFMGVNPEEFDIQNTNQGSNNQLTRLQNIINKKEPIIKNGKLNPKYRVIKASSLGEKFLLTRSEYESGIKKRCEQENEFFLQALGENFCDKEINFSNPLCYRQVLNHIDNEIPKHYADSFRDLALQLNGSANELAFELMSIAHMIKPEGPFIKEKLDEYSSLLD